MKRKQASTSLGFTDGATIKTTIYYFSATGNSLFVTRELAKLLGDVDLVPINAQTLKQVHDVPDAIGFVFPVYFCGIPKHSVSEIVKSLKGSSCHYINDMKVSPRHFEWQIGYGAFSVSQSSVSKVVNYIRTQEEHHKQVTFNDEFIAMLKKYEVKFDSKYLFEQI